MTITLGIDLGGTNIKYVVNKITDANSLSLLTVQSPPKPLMVQLMLQRK